MKLPGIGQKTAARLAFFCLDMDEEAVLAFADALIRSKRDLHQCAICGNITETDPCNICSDTTRDASIILVVENPRDVMSMEKIREYHGRYHVLNGVLSPMEGTGPEDLNIASLIKRLQDETVKEIALDLLKFCKDQDAYAALSELTGYSSKTLRAFKAHQTMGTYRKEA